MKATHQVGRNEHCPCGSGKKFKKCCLAAPQSREPLSLPLTTGQAPRFLPVNRLLHPPSPSPVRSNHYNEVLFDVPLARGGRLHAAFLYSDEAIRMKGIRRGVPVALELPDIGYRATAIVMDIRRSALKPESDVKLVRVVQFRDEDDLGKVLCGEWTPPQEYSERWQSRRRQIVMRMEFPDDSWCDVLLMRTLAWMTENNARAGEDIFLDLEHVGVRGWAKVLEILPCRPVELGDGELVTGTFNYSHGRIGELVLESESEPIGVTSFHPFWSVDRQGWVPVSELRPEERIETLHGATRVVSFTLTDRIEPVYNLEVAYDHCYRVGQSGVLVHNQSLPPARHWPTCSKIPPGGAARDYQIKACGSVEYEVSGGGAKKCADAVEGTVVVDCKALTNPNSSPQTGTAPDFVTSSYREKELAGLKVYEQIIQDPCSGLTSLKIRVQDSRQVAFWKALLSNLSISTSVEVSP